MICPNITSPEWKALVAKVGENRAWKEFLIYGKTPSADNYEIIDAAAVKDNTGKASEVLEFRAFQSFKEYEEFLEVKRDFTNDFASAYLKHSAAIDFVDRIFDKVFPGEMTWGNYIIDPKTGQTKFIVDNEPLAGMTAEELNKMVRAKFNTWFKANLKRELDTETINLNGKEINIKNPSTTEERVARTIFDLFATFKPAVENYVFSKEGLEADVINDLSVKYKVVVYNPDNDEDKQVFRSIRTKSTCLLYTSPSPRDGLLSRMPSSA